MAARASRPPRGQAQRLQTEANALRTYNQQMYLTRVSSNSCKGGIVIPLTIGQHNRTVLVRRLNLAEKLRAGVWDRSLTNQVRQIMMVGNVAAMQHALQDPADYDKFKANAYTLIRMAVMAVPEPVLEGRLSIEELTDDMLKPYFVESDPDPDQQILVDEEVYEAVLNERNKSVQRLRLEDDLSETEEAALKKAVAELNRRLSDMHVMNYEDALALAGKIVQKGPGALNDFRPVKGNPLGSVELASVVGDEDERAPVAATG